MEYKIYTKRNLADTTRDTDFYVYKQLGVTKNLVDALNLANQYIRKSFFRKDTRLRKGDGNVIYTALDFCSYGERIIVEEIK